MSLASEGVDKDFEVSSSLDIYQLENECGEWAIETVWYVSQLGLAQKHLKKETMWLL